MVRGRLSPITMAGKLQVADGKGVYEKRLADIFGAEDRKGWFREP